MIPAATSASTAASSSGSVSWPPQRARNASQAPAKHFFFSHISCPNFSKNLSRHTVPAVQPAGPDIFPEGERCSWIRGNPDAGEPAERLPAPADRRPAGLFRLFRSRDQDLPGDGRGGTPSGEQTITHAKEAAHEKFSCAASSIPRKGCELRQVTA